MLLKSLRYDDEYRGQPAAAAARAAKRDSQSCTASAEALLKSIIDMAMNTSSQSGGSSSQRTFPVFAPLYCCTLRIRSTAVRMSVAQITAI